MSREDLVYDAWTALSFKRAMGNRRAPGVNWLAPTWVGDHDRRLQAYKLLQAYLDNAGRVFLATDDESERERHREYGDAALVRDTILAALLGSDVDINVDGADDYDPDADDPEITGGTADPGSDPEARAAWEFQEWLRDWYFQAERGRLKLMETERDAVGLGDGVYTLGYSEDKQRVRLRCWDPGFYFPVLDDGNEDDFPRTVHIAWEEPRDPQQPGKLRVRRLTWRLGPITPVIDPAARIPTIAAGPGDRLDTDGRVSRQYDWNDQPSYETCYHSDGVWEIDELPANGRGIGDLDPGRGDYTARDVDLRIDFLPVVHIPNTVAVKNHYGQSSIARVLQILDDLSNIDTDLQGAAATAGQPILALEGGTLGNSRARYAPGEVWETGGGKLHWLTTEGALTGLGELSDRLYSRMAMVSRIPEGLLGRIKASEVPSGIALALSFGPLSSLMAEMRLSRSEKYPLLFKFAWRMSRASRVEGTPDSYHDAQLALGSFLPSDRGAIVTEVSVLLTAKAISRLTAIRLLIAAGIEIDDANEEVDRIEAGDFAGAGELLDVLGDVDAVRTYLKREDSTTAREPAPDNPPAIDPTTGLPIPPAPAPAPAPAPV